eukprot:305888_1
MNISNFALFHYIGSNALVNLKQIVLNLKPSCVVHSRLLLKNILNTMKMFVQDNNNAAKLDWIDIHSSCTRCDRSHVISEWSQTFEHIKHISLFCKVTSVSLVFHNTNPMVDMNELVSCLLNKNIKIAIKFLISPSNNVKPNNNDSDKELAIKGKKFAMELIEAYNTCVKPFLLITKQTIKITIENVVGFWLSIERYGFWDEYISDIQQTIEEQCDACVIDKTSNGFSMMYDITCD